MVRTDSDGYEYEYDLFDKATEKQLHAFFCILIPVDNENEGNKLFFEIEQAIGDCCAGAYACAAFPLVSDREEFFNGIDQVLRPKVDKIKNL